MSKKKRMRLPNGFGQITELKGRSLRKPFRAMVTVGKDDVGKPICKLLKPEAYFRTYNEAYAALIEYHRNPYDIAKDITAVELYQKWSEEHFPKISESTVRGLNSAWAYCSEVYSMKIGDIRIRHIKGCMEEGVVKDFDGTELRTPSAPIKKKIKSVFNQMLDYAVEYELVSKNYSRDFTIPKEIQKEEEANRKEHIAYTDEEETILWENINNVECVDMLLIQCYSGWRPEELCQIKIKDVTEDYFSGGMKSEAGTYRTVPIHPKIAHLVKNRYDQAVSIQSKYLFNNTKGVITYRKFYRRLGKIIEVLHLNPDHKPHDGRNTFVTLAKKYNVNEYAIKYMVGHAITDITEKVYTKRNNEWLKEEIEKIK